VKRYTAQRSGQVVGVCVIWYEEYKVYTCVSDCVTR